jgi:peroxiredoxin
MLDAGVSAPDFEIDGFSLGEARRNGPVLLAFFKVSCPTCQLAFPFLQRMSEGSNAGGPRLVAISQDDRSKTEQFRQRFNISVETLIDAAPGYQASNLYGLRNVPSLFLVEPDGRISTAFAGFSKADFEKLGERFGARVFRPDERVPEFQPG